MIAAVLLAWAAGIALGVQLGRIWYRNAEREVAYAHELAYWQALADPPTQYDWAAEEALP